MDLELFEMEQNILFESAKLDFTKGVLSEATKEGSGKGFIEKAFDALITAVKTLAEKIVSLFSNKQEKMKERAKKDKEFRDKQIEYFSAKKFDQNAKWALKELQKPGADVHKIMAEYKLRREKLNDKIGVAREISKISSIIVSGITMKKYHDLCEERADEIRKLKSKLSEVSGDAAYFSIKYDIADSEAKNYKRAYEITKDKANAMVTIMSDQNEDLLKEVKSQLEAIDEEYKKRPDDNMWYNSTDDSSHRTSMKYNGDQEAMKRQAKTYTDYVKTARDHGMTSETRAK